MSNRTRRDLQANARLALIAIPLLACIAFALFSLLGQLLGSDTWAWLTQIASALMGTLGLLAGCVTLIFQITRRQVSLRNVIAFGCLYILAIFVFIGSCVPLIESVDNSDYEGDEQNEDWEVSQGALPPYGEYPEDAWYTYMDPTCDYACMVTEYFYWALTSLLHAQSDNHRCNDIADEWALCTNKQVKSRDPDVYSLLTDSQYALPTILPDGNYTPSQLSDSQDIQTMTIIEGLPDEWQFLSEVFSKYVNVFGVNIFATKDTPNSKVGHASNVLAQYLDNNADGTPDNPAVVNTMSQVNASMIMVSSEDAMESLIRRLPGRFHEMIDNGQLEVQDLYGEETDRPEGFDASLEEVLHLISSVGYARTYPDIFGEEPDSTIATYMDNARGGHFEERRD